MIPKFDPLDLHHKVAHEASYDGKDWTTIAVTTGDHRPQFYYGKPWTNHVKTGATFTREQVEQRT